MRQSTHAGASLLYADKWGDVTAWDVTEIAKPKKAAKAAAAAAPAETRPQPKPSGSFFIDGVRHAAFLPCAKPFASSALMLAALTASSVLLQIASW
jgi:hypothetical protein